MIKEFSKKEKKSPKTKPRLTYDQNMQIIFLIENNHSLVDIAKHYGISARTVNDIAHRYGVKRKTIKYHLKQWRDP